MAIGVNNSPHRQIIEALMKNRPAPQAYASPFGGQPGLQAGIQQRQQMMMPQGFAQGVGSVQSPWAGQPGLSQRIQQNQPTLAQTPQPTQSPFAALKRRL